MKRLALSFALAGLALSAYAAIAVESNPALVQALRNASVVRADFPLHVYKNGNEATVSTLRNPKDADKSLKIDAVMAAKAIMDSDKSVLIVHYRMRLKGGDPDFKVITVRESDVKAYGAKAIDENVLLNELKVLDRTDPHQRPFARQKSARDGSSAPQN